MYSLLAMGHSSRGEQSSEAESRGMSIRETLEGEINALKSHVSTYAVTPNFDLICSPSNVLHTANDSHDEATSIGELMIKLVLNNDTALTPPSITDGFIRV